MKTYEMLDRRGKIIKVTVPDEKLCFCQHREAAHADEPATGFSPCSECECEWFEDEAA